MSIWYIKNLGDAMLAGNSLELLRQQFDLAYADTNAKDLMALFVRHESAGDLHCELMVYFTPEAAVVARTVNARACPCPSPAGLDLYSGSTKAWSLLSFQA